MAIDVSTVAVPLPPAIEPVPESDDSDQRWAAWRAKGAAHDRAVRRKMVIVAPILIVLAGAIIYALGG